MKIVKYCLQVNDFKDRFIHIESRYPFYSITTIEKCSKWLTKESVEEALKDFQTPPKADILKNRAISLSIHEIEIRGRNGN